MLNDGSGFKKVYLATGFTDLRRGIDGLARIIRFQFQLDPYDKNTLFLFCGKRTNRIKGLIWEAVCDLNAAEPEDLELKSPKQPKRKGKKQIFPAFRSDGSTIICPKRNWKQNSVSKVGNSYRMPFPENIILYLRR